MKKLLMCLSTAFLIVLTASCGSTKSTDESVNLLTDINWQLTSIDGKDAVASNYNSGLPEATFTTNNKVSGNGGCNRYSGAYNLNEEGGINVSELISTKMACPGNGEAEYIKALTTANVAKVEKDKLVLYDGVKELLVFTPKK